MLLRQLAQLFPCGSSRDIMTGIYAVVSGNDGPSGKDIVLSQAISDDTVHLFQIDK